MKQIAVLMMLIVSLGALAAPGAPVPAGTSTKAVMDQYFSADNPKLTPQEKGGVAISTKWREQSAAGLPPAPGADGTINYLYGATQPSIVCAVLQICVIELQAGETVTGIHLGDQLRWSVEPAIEGSGASERQLLVIKPHDVGLDTSLVVPTNRRTYFFRLRSHRTEYMTRVAFVYPEVLQAKWDLLKAREQKDRQEKTIPETREYLGNLNFEYTISGEASWKPVRVYNDGAKTIIQMPSTMSQTEAPTLLVLRKEEGLFTDEETVLVNYRVQSDRYIVDTLFDKAILIVGVGSSQDRVVIERGKQ